jgi:hypothetical protein
MYFCNYLTCLISPGVGETVLDVVSVDDEVLLSSDKEDFNVW